MGEANIYPGGSLVSIQDTGKGNPALEWTLGAQAVELELDPTDCSYRIIKAACTMDVGKLINPAMARGQIAGGMAMALSFHGRKDLSLTIEAM